ncbi:MAG: hypothetical protein ACXWKN_00695 [Phenylobacterium sp.]
MAPGAPLRWTILAAAVASLALIVFGVAATPGVLAMGSRWLGPLAAAAMVGLYAAVGAWAHTTDRRRPETMVWAQRAGFAAAGVYVGEILLEYAVQPADNTSWGLVEFAAVFACYAMAGAGGAARSRRLWPAVQSALWAAAVATLVWYAVLLAVTFAFTGTAAQQAVFRAEGDFDDFRRSGLSDFKVFSVQDLLGAGFFHLLLSPIFAAILGLLGAAPVRMAQAWRGRRRPA